MFPPIESLSVPSVTPAVNKILPETPLSLSSPSPDTNITLPPTCPPSPPVTETPPPSISEVPATKLILPAFSAPSPVLKVKSPLDVRKDNPVLKPILPLSPAKVAGEVKMLTLPLPNRSLCPDMTVTSPPTSP